MNLKYKIYEIFKEMYIVDYTVDYIVYIYVIVHIEAIS